jgi:hemolysin activation/secretion protein
VKAQQAIERNVPEAPVAPTQNLTAPTPQYNTSDTQSLGVDLKGVRLIGPAEEATGAPPAGISIGNVRGIKLEDMREALEPFLDKPLSRGLLGQLQAAVTQVYRRADYFFVSVTVPPQEITGGIIQLRVIEFRVGDVVVSGARGGKQPRLDRGIRAADEDRIEGRQIAEDLEWLNRSQYRRVQGEFSPGEDAATSRLSLKVTETKPWHVTGGWSNSGTRSSGRDRGFIGGGVWLPWLNDTTLSYQLTTNEDVWNKPSRIRLQEGDMPRYLSHAGRITIPTFSRQAIELAPSFVSLSQDADEFISFDNTVFELPVLYRSALSNLLPGIYFGDIYAGAEFKFLSRKTFFDDIEVAQGKAEVVNFIIGWSHALTDPRGRTSFDVKLKGNPGGILDGNDDETWRLFSGGRIEDIKYFYAAADIVRVTPLPKGFGWVSQVSAVGAFEALPDTERMSLSGFYMTRGYGIDDATIDSGFVWRNELRLPTFAPLTRLNLGIRDAFSPFAFFDIGHGRDFSAGENRTLMSAGVGFDYALNGNVSANVALGYALRDAGLTQVGDWNLQARVSVNF